MSLCSNIFIELTRHCKVTMQRLAKFEKQWVTQQYTHKTYDEIVFIAPCSAWLDMTLIVPELSISINHFIKQNNIDLTDIMTTYTCNDHKHKPTDGT